MSFVRRAQDARTRDVTGAGDPWAIPSNGSLSKYASSGVPVDQDAILSLTAVTRSVDLISTSIAGLPLDAVKAQGAIRVPIEPPPLVISDPFGGANVLNGFGVTPFEGLSQVMVSLLFRGNAYINIVRRDKTGMPDTLQVLNPDAVKCELNRETGAREYEVNRNPFPTHNMLHVRGLTLPGQPVGVSVLGYAKRTFGLAIAAEEFGSMFFGQAAHPSGIITIPGDMTSDNARAIKEGFESKHSGMRHAHEVSVLTGGAEFKPISITPEEAQFLATRQIQTEDIAMLFGVPPHLLGRVDRTTSWGKGIEEQDLAFLKYTLARWLRPLEDAFSVMLPDPWKARFNIDAFARSDTSGRYKSYLLSRTAAFMTPNEIRALENLPPIEGGDDLFAPLNSAHTTDPGWTPNGWLPDETDPHTPAGSPLLGPPQPAPTNGQAGTGGAKNV